MNFLANLKRLIMRRPLVVGVVAVFILCVVICAILYFAGVFSVWSDARKAQQEVNAQKQIAAEEKAKREAAEKEAAGWKGIAEDYKSKAEFQEGISNELRSQIQTAIQELGERRAATANSSRAYDAVRNRRPAPRPDDTADAIAGRLRAGAAELRNSNN